MYIEGILMKRRVVITGMGTVSAIRCSVDEIWKNARVGVCGIGKIDTYDTGEMKAKVAAEIKGFN